MITKRLKAFLPTSKEPDNCTSPMYLCPYLSCTKFKPFAKDKTWHLRQPLAWIYLIYLHEVGWCWCCAFTQWIYITWIYMHIHEHVWIWSFKCINVYVHAYLYQYVSALFTEQKRKYIIYSACRWIIAFNGTTKHQNSMKSSLHTAKQRRFPLVHTLLGHTSGVSWCFLKVFAAEWRECDDGLTVDAFNHSHLSISDSTAMTMASVPLQLQWPCTHPKRVQP